MLQCDHDEIVSMIQSTSDDCRCIEKQNVVAERDCARHSTVGLMELCMTITVGFMVYYTGIDKRYY